MIINGAVTTIYLYHKYYIGVLGFRDLASFIVFYPDIKMHIVLEYSNKAYIGSSRVTNST